MVRGGGRRHTVPRRARTGLATGSDPGAASDTHPRGAGVATDLSAAVGPAGGEAALSQRGTAADLVEEHGQCFADEAAITLRDKPSPLFCLLVLSMLSSAPIGAGVAASAARELFRAGWRTPDQMRRSTWRQRVDALDRARYRRYDESTATRLEQLAEHVLAQHRGDLRSLRPAHPGDVPAMRAALEDCPRVGPTGSAIFAREVQGVWPEVSPFFDERALRAARSHGLPDEPERLARLAPDGRVAVLASALVRADLRT